MLYWVMMLRPQWSRARSVSIHVDVVGGLRLINESTTSRWTGWRRHQTTQSAGRLGTCNNRLRKWLEVINYQSWLALMTRNERSTPLVRSISTAKSLRRHATWRDVLVEIYDSHIVTTTTTTTTTTTLCLRKKFATLFLSINLTFLGKLL